MRRSGAQPDFTRVPDTVHEEVGQPGIELSSCLLVLAFMMAARGVAAMVRMGTALPPGMAAR